MLILEKKLFSRKYIILAMRTLESEVNFLFFLLFIFNCSCCFDFSYPLSSAQVSLDCATLGRQINQWKTCSTVGHFLLFLQIQKPLSLCCIALNVCPKCIFISFYIDIRGLLRSQVYSRHFIDFSYCHLILCNAIF